MGLYLKTRFLRDQEELVTKGEISYGKMLENIEEEVIRNYTGRVKCKDHFSHLDLPENVKDQLNTHLSNVESKVG